jgi:membrane protease YdiL (CAAX protease family)
MKEENNNSPNEEDQSDSEVDKKEITCTNCGEKNPSSNLFCNFCGKHFVEEVKCAKCSEVVPVYNSYCSYCGAPMRLAQQSTKQMPQSSQSYQSPGSPPTYASQPQVIPPPFHELPPEIQERIRAQQRRQKLETRNTIATVFGIIFLVLGIGALILFFLFLFVYEYDALSDILGSMDLGLTSAALYGAIIGMLLTPTVILLITGISLLAYKPNNDAWKGFFRVSRIIFLAFSSFLAVLIIFSVIGWIFYNPSEVVSINEYFWLFYVFVVPIDMTKSNLYILLFSLYFICILLMTLPTLVKFILKRIQLSNVENKETQEGADVTPLLDKEISKSKSQQELHILRLNPIEERKGIMPNAFYQLKNMTLTKSVELLGASMISSIIIIFILTPFIGGGDTDPGTDDPFVTISAVAWAGIFEEISFRLILIGIPMTIVVLARYIIQESTKPDPIFPEKIEGKKKIMIQDILLAFRGKYKSIGYIEWLLIGISSLLFGFAHWEGWTGSWGAWKIVQAGLSGFFLSYAFVKYGIESAIFIHLTNNVISALSVYTAEVANTGWLAFTTNFVTWGLMFIGVMKGISVIINLVMNRGLKQRTESSKLL